MSKQIHIFTPEELENLRVNGWGSGLNVTPLITLPTKDDIDAYSRKFGTRTINGKIPWEQDQYGNNRESFRAGFNEALKLFIK